METNLTLTMTLKKIVICYKKFTYINLVRRFSLFTQPVIRQRRPSIIPVLISNSFVSGIHESAFSGGDKKRFSPLRD